MLREDGASGNLAALLREDHSVTLEWNPGNHFQDSELRTAKAFCWVAAREKRRMAEGGPAFGEGREA